MVSRPYPLKSCYLFTEFHRLLRNNLETVSTSNNSWSLCAFVKEWAACVLNYTLIALPCKVVGCPPFPPMTSSHGRKGRLT